MKDEQDYIRDIAAMRAMMERSSKFLSLSGLAGVMAGIYALAGAFIAYRFLDFNPQAITSPATSNPGTSAGLLNLVLLGWIVLVLALGTAVYLSYRKSHQRGLTFWDPTARRLLATMAVPLVTGGILILLLIQQGWTGWIAPFSLVFYGLALFNAGKFTYEEVKSLGLIQIVLGLIGAYFVPYGLLCWAVGFGLVHIIYGIYMHYRYER